MAKWVAPGESLIRMKIRESLQDGPLTIDEIRMSYGHSLLTQGTFEWVVLKMVKEGELGRAEGRRIALTS